MSLMVLHNSVFIPPRARALTLCLLINPTSRDFRVMTVKQWFEFEIKVGSPGPAPPI